MAAFAALLEESAFADISVKAISSRAGINRASFYRHFEGIGDLVDRGIGGVLDELVEELERGPRADGPDERIRRLFEIAWPLREELKPLLSPTAPQAVREKLRRELNKALAELRLSPALGGGQRGAAVGMLAEMVAAALCAALGYWLRERPDWTAERAARYYADFVMRGAASFLSAPAPRQD